MSVRKLGAVQEWRAKTSQGFKGCPPHAIHHTSYRRRGRPTSLGLLSIISSSPRQNHRSFTIITILKTSHFNQFNSSKVFRLLITKRYPKSDGSPRRRLLAPTFPDMEPAIPGRVTTTAAGFPLLPYIAIVADGQMAHGNHGRYSGKN